MFLSYVGLKNGKWECGANVRNDNSNLISWWGYTHFVYWDDNYLALVSDLIHAHQK